MKRKQKLSIWDLSRVPVTPTKYADDEKPTTTLAAFRAEEARREQESAAKLQTSIQQKQTENSRIIKECLETSAPLKAQFWSQPLDRLKVSLNNEEAFDELFLQKDSADVDSNEIYDRVMTFLTSMPSLEAEDERRFSLYVACQVLNDVIVDDESLKVMFDRCLLLGIFKGTAELQRPATPKPLVIEPKRESLEDFESIDTTSRDGSRRAKNLAENLYVEEMIPIATAFVTSIQKHYGFSPTSEDMRRVSTWIVEGMWLSFQGGYGQQMMDWRNPPMVPATTVNFSIADVPQTVPNQPVFGVVSFKLISEEGHFGLEWLKEDTFGKKLIDPKTGEVLPHLKMFWEKVSGLTPEAATVFLEEQLEASTRGTVSFFGIPVETRLAASASPIVCFSILLFLGLHIRHIRLAQGSIEAAVNFPFAPLFQDASGALLVTYATVLVLPTLAVFELLNRFGDWTQWSTRIGTVFAIFTTLTGVWTVVEILRLRKRLS